MIKNSNVTNKVFEWRIGVPWYVSINHNLHTEEKFHFDFIWCSLPSTILSGEKCYITPIMRSMREEVVYGKSYYDDLERMNAFLLVNDKLHRKNLPIDIQCIIAIFFLGKDDIILKSRVAKTGVDYKRFFSDEADVDRSSKKMKKSVGVFVPICIPTPHTVPILSSSSCSSSSSPVFDVKPSLIPNAGKGLFSKLFISKNDEVGEYFGKKISYRVWKRMSNEESAYVMGGVYGEDGVYSPYIDARDSSSLMKYINHSQNANVKAYFLPERSSDSVFIYALRDIVVGEELLMDYGYEPSSPASSSSSSSMMEEENIVVNEPVSVVAPLVRPSSVCSVCPERGRFMLNGVKFCHAHMPTFHNDFTCDICHAPATRQTEIAYFCDAHYSSSFF